VTVGRFRSVAATEERDMFRTDEGVLAAKSSQRGVSPTYGERQTHARHRSRLRFLWRGEIRVRIHVDKTYGGIGCSLRTQEGAQYDAAVTANEHNEAFLRHTHRDAIGERRAVFQ
jgi:hypothetical protein